MGLRMGFSVPGLVLLGVLLLATNTEGSHFRYGTISWRPNIELEAYNAVTFLFDAAYRRDFEWGKFFREQWAIGPTDTPDWQDGGSCYTLSRCSVRETGPAVPENYYQFFSSTSVDYTAGGTGGWYIRLAVGRSYYELNTINNGDGKQCTSPYDTGDRPTCKDGNPEGYPQPNGNVDPVTGVPVPYYLNPSVGDLVPCETSENVDPDYCSPWSQTYGFFFGDDNHTDIILTITEVNHENNQFGNFIRGQSTFDHMYTEKKKDTQNPWTAYFTGGNRITKTKGNLNNNHQGRFRLEITVNIVGQNLSPIATSFPVVPIPYNGRGPGQNSAYGMLATFQISAYDANFDERVFLDLSGNNKELYNEEVFFFIGDSQKHGVLLANQVPDLKYPSNWYRERYEDARLDCYNISCTNADGTILPYPGSCGNCPKGGGKICSTTSDVDDDGNLYVRKLEFSCEEYPEWENAENLAHGPPRMVMNVTTGVVQWETGVNPYEVDFANYSTNWDRDGDQVHDDLKGQLPPDHPQQPLPLGFYNLVVDIRSRSRDQGCILATQQEYQQKTPSQIIGTQEATWLCSLDEDGPSNLTRRDAPATSYISTPLDFLLYLYPPASWCAKSCLNSAAGMTTFRDFGFYGDQRTEDASTLVDVPGGWRYDAPGTGQCTICGGPQTPDTTTLASATASLTNVTLCLGTQNCGIDATAVSESVIPDYSVCNQNTFPMWVNQSDPGVPDGNTPTAFYGEFYAKFYGKRSKPVTFNLIAYDVDDCVELSIHPTGLYKGYTMYEIRDTLEPNFEKPMCTYRESQLNECGFDMVLSNTTRVGTDGKTVKRIFTWGAKKNDASPELEQEKDPRPPNVTVCFFPFDEYSVGAFRCVNIILTSDKELYWRDQRPGLKDHGEGFQGPTPSNETTFYVAPGNKLDFVMSAKQGTGYAPIRIWVSQGELPRGMTMVYTEPDPKLRDPASTDISWVPEEGQQCEYMICFIGNNSRDYEDDIDYTFVYELSACNGMEADKPCLDERCYSIIVMDQTLDFGGGTYIDAPDVLPALTAECGMSVGLWFLPEGTTTMPLITMGYYPASSTQYVEVHKLSWEPSTRAEFNDRVTSQDLGQYYRLVYTSGMSQVTIMTDPDFCIEEWHYAMITIAPDGHATLYLDGVQTYHFAEDTRDFHQIDVIDTTGTIPVVDGKVEIIGTVMAQHPGSTGFFLIGSDFMNPYDGMITDVRVYSRALSSQEVADKMFKVLDPTEEIALEAYYKFNEGSQIMAPVKLGNQAGGFNIYRQRRNSTESMVNGDTTGDNKLDSPWAPYPEEMNAREVGAKMILDYSGNGYHASPPPAQVAGDLHYEFAAAPTMPACPKEFSPDNVHVDGGKYITISGTGFARSQFLKCSFSMADGNVKIVKAEHVDNSTIICRNPGAKYLTASMLEVTNGAYYSDMKIPIYMMERAISFPDTGGAVTVPDICFNLGELGFSIGAWVYPITDSTGALFTLTGPEGIIEVSYQVSNFLVAEHPTGGPRTALGVSGPAPAAGMGEGAGWHYVMITGTSQYEYKLYVDGEEFPVASPSVQFVSTACDLVIGGDTTSLHGLVEEVTMWSKSLSLCQSYQIMWGNLTTEKLCPEGNSVQTAWNQNLESYLKMNDFGVVAKDISGRQKDGILSGTASFMFTTVPFKAPSFNRPRPRTGPPTKQFDYGPNALMMENYTIPRAFHSYYDYVPFFGRFETELQGHSLEGDYASPREDGSMLTVDGMKNMTILGFGFAESKWLKCEFDGELTDVVYVGIDEVWCDVPEAPYPGRFDLGVLNMYPDHATCEAEYWGVDAHRLVAHLPNKLEMKEAAVFFDGIDDYAWSHEVAKQIGSPTEPWEGVTFGAWFYPMETDADKEQPIMCFTTKCTAPPPPPPTASPPPPSPPPCSESETACETIFPPPGSPPPPLPTPSPPLFDTVTGAEVPYAQVCLMYKDQHVYIQSDITSATYNDLYFNSTAGFKATANEWHYAEIVINGVEVDPVILSDKEDVTGNIPTYIASMIVDGVVVDGSPAGDIRVPMHPESLAQGGFFVGGEGCDDPENNPFFSYPSEDDFEIYNNEYPAKGEEPKDRRRRLQQMGVLSSTHFRGYIDEVRVFKGEYRSDWFHRLNYDSDAPTPIAHYRMSNTRSGALSQDIYAHKPIGPYIADSAGEARDLIFFEFGNNVSLTDPTYEYLDVPYEAATTWDIDVESLMLNGTVPVTLTGYNVAQSQWLKCLFYGADIDKNTGVFEFDAYHVVDAEFIDHNTVKCTAPGAVMPTYGYAQIGNPRANGISSYMYEEYGMEFEGDQVKEYEVIGGTANEGEQVDLVCPAGMRMDKVIMASYGRPKNRCNAHNVTNCDLTKTVIPCDYLDYEVNKACHSDSNKPPYFTFDRVEKYCLGKSVCSIPALNSIFGDPCPSSSKWLSVAMRCSDRWTTKDHVQMDHVNAELASGAYSFGAWVYPHAKPGIQSIVSMGGAPGQDLLNRAILQWRGDASGNTGRFYYYDDCINDVMMKYDDGRDIVLQSNQWYQIFLTRDEYGNGLMILNGFVVASFTTACKPDADGNMFLGMDLSDEMMPKEYFDGIMDEVMVFNYNIAPPIPGTDIVNLTTINSLCWTASQTGDLMGMVSYYKFNKDNGDTTPDELGGLPGVLAQSADTIWNVNSQTWASAPGLNESKARLGDSEHLIPYDWAHYVGHHSVHTSYTSVGAPWYPTSTLEVHSATPILAFTGTEETPGPLMGGAVVTLTGLNFAPINSRVFYGEPPVEILYEYVDHHTMTATIPDLKDPPTCTEGGTYDLKVINSLGPLSDETCNVGMPTLQEKVNYTQALEVKDMQQSLICWFPFYGDTADYSGHAKHATNNGGSLVFNRDGYFDQAYMFTVTDDIDIAACTGGKTVAMWIYYDDLLFPTLHYSNVPFFAYEAETGCQASDEATINNAWTHVVGVVDGGVVTKIYVNGKVSTITKYGEQILSVIADKKIGGGGFSGKVDDVWIWDRELCDSEIVATYNVQEYALEFGFGTELSVPLVAPPIPSTATPLAAAQGSHGLLATFFGAGIEHVEVLDVMQQDYAAVAPASGFSVDEWSVELTGYVYAPYSSEYYFTITADDSFRLWINKGPAKLEANWVTGEGPEGYYWSELDNLWVESDANGTPTNNHHTWVNIINEPCIKPECDEREVSGNCELYQGWYQIYMSYTDKRNTAGFSLRWQTTDGDIPKQLIPAEYLKSGTGPFTVEAWIWPYTVDGDHTVISRTYAGLNGLGVGIYNGAMSASLYTGCFCSKIECDEYREVHSWKTVVKADQWQHIAATYDGKQWMLYVNEILLDTIYYETNKFLPETHAPVVLGRENDKQIVAGPPDEIRQYYGLIHSFAMFSEVRPISIKCPHSPTLTTLPDLMIALQLNEGIGNTAFDFTGKTPTTIMFQDAVITPPAEPHNLWVEALCGTWGTDPSRTEIAGTALVEAMAGKCAVFTLASFDQCSHKKLVGGDKYKVEIVGPLHLHTETITLTVGDGIMDHEDGSYTVTFNRETSGYYLIKVFLTSEDGEDIRLDYFKTYVHPYVADCSLTYMFDDLADPLYLDELENSMAGIPVSFNLQTVDKFGNLRTHGGINDWEITFTGPYDFNGTWVDNSDGTYTFSYLAHIAGHYRMEVKMAGCRICAYGGSTCCGGTKSSYGYCTMDKQAIAPAGNAYAFEECLFCINVYDGSSLALSTDSVVASFPDSDPLDLEGSFTIFGFIKKGANTGHSREYIVSKMSDYSGKGYYLSLKPTAVEGEFEMEGGVYVGSETFRHAKEVVAIPFETWVHVAMTYDGSELAIFVDAVEVERTHFDTVAYQKRSAQPVVVGKNFGGLIDNIMVYSEVRDVAEFVPDSFCPANMKDRVPNFESKLIAYYRFNENSGFATKDSSHHGNDGIVGLVCDIAAEGKNAKLQCPTGYVISDILYANFGENDGSCGDFVSGDCVTDGSMDVVSTACKGQESCTVLASKDVFASTCLATQKSLAINAVCTSASKSSWSLDTAPTLVGVTTTVKEDLICPKDHLGLGIFPEWLEADLTKEFEAGAACKNGAATTHDGLLSTATAGQKVIWGVVAEDGCGYRSLHGTDIFDGEVNFPLFRDLSLPDKCPEFSLSKLDNVPVDFTAGSASNNYCGTFNDLYVMTYTATEVGDGMLTVNLNGEAVIASEPFHVIPAGISANGTTATGSGLHSAEAGIEAMFTVVAKDAFGNDRAQWGDEEVIAVEIEGNATASVRMTHGADPGTYLVYVHYPVAGHYHVSVHVNGEVAGHAEAHVTATELRPVTALNTAAPVGRFEHTMVSYMDEVYAFGGARADKTYLDETVKFHIAHGTVVDDFKYRRLITRHGMDSVDYTAEVIVPTMDMIADGKLKADCSDLYFFSFAGEAMSMWVEPHSAPAGCGTAQTVAWVKVPAGVEHFWMYYGNKAAPSISDASSVFAMFEDFEGDWTPESAGWVLDDATDDTCDTDPGYNPGDISSFYQSNLTSVSGDHSLKADAVDMLGGSLKKAFADNMSKFTLKAYMYDSGCDGAHWISADYEPCKPVDNDKSLLPNANTGAGIFTHSAPDVYCTNYPWRASPAKRSQGWHSFTMRDNDVTMAVTFDEYTDMPLRTEEVTTDLTKVFLRSHRLPDQDVGSSVYWDAIMVTSYDDSVSTTVSDLEEPVSYDSAAVWSVVGATNPPPARQAHTAVVYDHAMYVFGGERSAYEYGDLWKYEFMSDTWAFQPTANSSAHLGRHDHSAVVYGDSMYVYGGRSPAPLDDFWQYSFTAKTWTPMPTSHGMHPRFGHTAAVDGDKMFVFGGYVAGDMSAGMLTDEIWSFDFTTMAWTKVGPRYDNYAEDYIASPTDAMIFPMALPNARFSHCTVMAGSAPAFYAIGGAGGADMMMEEGTLWKFDVHKLEWTLMMSHDLLARYDAAVSLFGNGKYALVYGGHANGKFLDDMFVIYVGETGY